MTNGMEVEHDSGRERAEWAGDKSRERRMHELGTRARDDKPVERGESGLAEEPIQFLM